MTEDIFKSIKAFLYDRAVSPLLGSFAMSWAVVNYRAIFALFAPMPINDKFNYIDTILYPGGIGENYFQLFIYPLTMAIIYIFLYPYPARLVYWVAQIQRAALKKIILSGLYPFWAASMVLTIEGGEAASLIHLDCQQATC